MDSDPALAIGAGPAVPGAAGALAVGLADAGLPLGVALADGLGLGDAPLGAAEGSAVACATTVDERASTLATIRSRPSVEPVTAGAAVAGISTACATVARGAAVAAATAASIARALAFDG